MSKLLIVCCVLFLAMAASADQLLYVIDNFAGSTTMTISPIDATGWSNLQVIGTGNRSGGNFKAFYWTPSMGSTPREMLGLAGYDNAILAGMSSDGSVIVGVSASTDVANTQVAARFYSDGTTSATRIDSITGTMNASVGSISSDGTTAVGYRRTGTASTAFIATKWDIATSTATNLAAGYGRAYNADDDAQYIVGRKLTAPGGYVLNTGTNTYYTLPNAGTNYAGLQDVRGITSDGQYAFGIQASTAGATTANLGVVWKWDSGTSAYVVDTLMPTMDGYTNDLQWVPGWNQNNISDDAGKYVVGYVKHADSTFSPFIWDRLGTGKLYDLNVFLSASALAQIPSGFIIDTLTGISADGTAIFGNLLNSGTGETKAFVAMVPEPATIALLGLGGLALIRRKR